MHSRALHQLIHHFKIGLICLLMLLAVAMFPVPVRADKAMKALAFDAASGTVAVAAVYETAYSAQKGLIKSLKVSNKLMKKAPGFKGASTLQSQDGKQIISFSQWQDLASYQAYAPATSPSAAAIPAPTQTLVFNLGSAQTAIEGVTPALRGKEAVVQFAHFTPKLSSTQAQVLPSISNIMPTLLQKQPIPQAVILLKQVDSEDVALLTNWNCSALFEDVGKPAAIELSSDLQSITDIEQRLYNVVNIIPVETDDQEGDFKKGQFYD